MSGDSENTQSVAEGELETLQSIYVNELEVNYENDIPASVSICLHPATADNLEEQYVRFVLKFKLSEEYPDTVPDIVIGNARGLLDEQINMIHSLLSSIAEARKGASMLFELIEAAKEQLTGVNRPSEICAICLYEFLDEDVFTKTECYHYFHSYCLNIYVKSRITEADESEKDSSTSSQTLCPVCRLTIDFAYKEEGFPEPLAETAAAACASPEAVNVQQKEMEMLYQKQLAQGGIIDIEAEKNKYLLTTTSVLPKMSTSIEAPADLTDSASKSERERPAAQSRRKEQPDYHRFNARARGGFRQPNRRNYERNNDFQGERGKYNPNYRHQSNRHKKVNADREELGKLVHSLSISEESKESQNSHERGNLANEAQLNNGHQHYNRRGGRGNFRRPWNQTNAPRNYFNYRGHQSYRTDNNRGSKFQNSRDRQRPLDDQVHHHDANVLESTGMKSTDTLVDGTYIKEEHDKQSPTPGRNYDRKNSSRGPRQGYRTPSGSYHDRNQHQRYARKWDNVNGMANPGQKSESPEQESFREDGSADMRQYHPRSYHQYSNRSKQDEPNFAGSPRNDQYKNKEHSGEAQNFNHSAYRERRAPKDIGETDPGSKNPEENNVPKKGNRSNPFSSQPEPNESKSPNSISNNVGTKVSLKASTETTHSEEKNGSGTCRPPPGFANPLKKVVYGLPSLNPPPGFSRS